MVHSPKAIFANGSHLSMGTGLGLKDQAIGVAEIAVVPSPFWS